MKPVLSQSSIVQRNKEMITSNIDGEIVMMSVDQGEYYGLDEIGSRIWELIDRPVTVENLVGILLEEFEVEKEICERDTLEFLEELISKNLVITGENESH